MGSENNRSKVQRLQGVWFCRSGSKPRMKGDIRAVDFEKNRSKVQRLQGV
ncbi:hypothetical protein [Alkalimarinus alittae]|uniref:Uncharacterized protein n=1 Tax=Alkalimarinus alittae TaxID=2961619 RepID=A0ABY6N2X3_9ALTE|nr:hypothetical protein [Alkalimarinus alittae]UZE96375.1 hypothetical protein NKI27_01110 [Alkalimarinus alittae]